MRKLVFLCYYLPSWGLQSGPVLYRHLLRARDEWDVTCVHFHGKAPPDYGIATLHIPDRRPGWPPVRSWLPGSYALRKQLWVRHLQASLHLGPDDRVLCCLHTREHELARALSDASGAPLVVLLHDHWAHRLRPSDAFATLSRCRQVLAVSEGLARLAREHGATSTSVIYPIGDDPLDETVPVKARDEPTIGIAGSMGADYVAAALLVSNRLVALSDPLPEYSEDKRVRFVPRRPTNRDALRFLAAECDALAIYQTYTSSLWLDYSFPSRLVDFAQTGLPLVLLAPPASTLGRWAAARHWPLWLSDPEDAAMRGAIRTKLENPAQRESFRHLTAALRDGPFSAANIHAQFAEVVRS